METATAVRSPVVGYQVFMESATAVRSPVAGKNKTYVFAAHAQNSELDERTRHTYTTSLFSSGIRYEVKKGQIQGKQIFDILRTRNIAEFT